MPSNPLGPGVSRYLSGKDRQFMGVVFQAGKPPLDSEFNLMNFVDLEARASEVRSRVCSGWLVDDNSNYNDYFTSNNYSNYFYFGNARSIDQKSPTWAVVNGWTIPVAGSFTGFPPLAANDSDYRNRILLDPPSSSSGGNIPTFVFLEVWLARIDVDPPGSGVAVGKPARGFIYKYGNTQSGFNYLPDEMVDPDVNFETTKRVQVQYRIRTVNDVNLVDYPDGFDPAKTLAQGLLTSPSGIPFSNMKDELGDPGLWRAGTGDSSTFNTVDGYVYAIPLCSVFRRNTTIFSESGNLAGGYNRNSEAIDKMDFYTFSTPLALPGAITSSTSSISFTTIDNTYLGTMRVWTQSYFDCEGEIILVTGLTNLGLTYLIDISRGQLGTVARAHNAGVELRPYSLRPDGLFSDQIALSDILDMRHSVADKFDYVSILDASIKSLLKGDLRTTWKRNGATSVQGPTIFYGDKITNNSSTGSLTKLDSPDGNRRVWSDAVTVQKYTVPIRVPNNSSIIGTSELAVPVAPYNMSVIFNGTDVSREPGSREPGGIPQWFYGDSFRILKSSFSSAFGVANLDQVRFATSDDHPLAIVGRFDGMTTDLNGPTSITTSTSGLSPTSTLVQLNATPSANPILTSSNGFSFSIDPVTGDLIITLAGGTAGNALVQFTEALQTGNLATANGLYLYIDFTVIYGGGRGLSHRPKYINRVIYKSLGSNGVTMTRSGLSVNNSDSPMAPTYLSDSPYVQTGVDRTLAVTSDIMVDPGSKSVYVAPYRRVNLPALLLRNGNQNNWYISGLTVNYQGQLPTKNQTGTSTIHTVVDPIGLFKNGPSNSVFCELPQGYAIRPGFHHIPIVASETSYFSSGINFLLSAKGGAPAATVDFNTDLVRYPVGSPGYYIVTNGPLETFGNATPGGTGAFGTKTTINRVQGHGGPFKGIKFPAFYMPARITGVYIRNGSDVLPVSSPFNSNRIFVGGVGTDTNLLKDRYDGPTVLLYTDPNGDPYFILNADCLDSSKMPVGSTFDNSQFIVECVLFAVDRGFGVTNYRVCVSSTHAAITDNSFTNSGVGLIATAPLSRESVDNEVCIYYNRVPYQGDIYGTRDGMSDDAYHQGPPTLAEMNSIFQNPQAPVEDLTLPNPVGLEILATQSFVTSSGTGRIGGSGPIPLLYPSEAPLNPPDYANSIIDYNRQFTINRVGYEDWASTSYPLTQSSLNNRPSIEMDGLSELYDNDINGEFVGATTNLPLGSYFRDYDFMGKTLYQSRSSFDVGTIPLGTTCFTPFNAAISRGKSIRTDWEGVDYVCGSSTNAVGSDAESLIMVDGSPSAVTTTIYRTCRGGAGFVASGPFKGGPIASRFPKARGNSNAGSVLMCTAYLVRCGHEISNGKSLNYGGEIQMVVVTQAVANYMRDTEICHSANGTGEGFTAIDRFRVTGRPLEKVLPKVNVADRPSPPALFNTRVYDNSLFYGSADVNPIAQFCEILSISVSGQTAFSLTNRPISPSAVILFLNGLKLQYGVSFSLSGPSHQTLTYTGVETLVPTDVLEAWYVAY